MTGVWLLHDDVYSSASTHSFNYIQISIPTFLNNEGHYMHTESLEHICSKRKEKLTEDVFVLQTSKQDFVTA